MRGACESDLVSTLTADSEQKTEEPPAQELTSVLKVMKMLEEAWHFISSRIWIKKVMYRLFLGVLTLGG